MKTKVLGQIVTNKYSVDNKRKEIKDSTGESKMIYEAKPKLKKESKIEWTEICGFEGNPRYNSNPKNSVWSSSVFCKAINISEDEEVLINEEIFRADLNELHLRTNKILKEIDLNKDEMEIALNEGMKIFNKEMIETDEKLKSYCVLHKLSLEETDCMELFKLVYAVEECWVADGKLRGTSYTIENDTGTIKAITIETGTITTNAIYQKNMY